MHAPNGQYGRFVAEAAVAAIAIGAVAAGLHRAASLDLNAAVLVAGLGAIAAAGWIALGGVGAPNNVGAPNVPMNSFMDNGRASQGAMMIAQEALLQEQINFDMSKRNRPERAAEQLVAGRQSHVAAWAGLAAGLVAIAAAPFF